MTEHTTNRTAVYGPVRTVVWEGPGRKARPYPDHGCSSRSEAEPVEAVEPSKIRPGRGEGNHVLRLPPPLRGGIDPQPETTGFVPIPMSIGIGPSPVATILDPFGVRASPPKLSRTPRRPTLA